MFETIGVGSLEPSTFIQGMKIGNWVRKEIGRNLGKPSTQGLSREDSQRSGGKRGAGCQRSHEDSSVEHPTPPPRLRGASRLITSALWSIPPRHLISVLPLPAGWPDSFTPRVHRTLRNGGKHNDN